MLPLVFPEFVKDDLLNSQPGSVKVLAAIRGTAAIFRRVR
jgi:hypothetical protein